MRHRPAALGLERARLFLRVEGPDRLRGIPERRIVFVDPHMGEHADDRPLGDGFELGLDQRPDLRLRLSDREIERQRRHLVGGPLLAHQLVADLRPVSVGDDEVAVAQQRAQRLTGLPQVRALLGRGPALARPHQGVAAERDDCEHQEGLAERSLCRRAALLAHTGSALVSQSRQ